MDLAYIVLVLLIGFFAQLVDGSLGMGYGVTCATMLAAIGFAPAMASATIHVAKIGTGIMSGTAHWRFGNVNWRACFMLAAPGTVGAFAGALAISYIAADVAAPWVSVILATLGVVVLLRTVFGRKAALQFSEPRLVLLGPLGLVGGFIDSVGGGGWGPVTTSTLMAAGRMAPNQIIGTVSMSEFIVAIGATLGFLAALGGEAIAWDATVLLLLGALVAAPIAAWLVSRLDHRVLGGLVGGMILFYNAENVLRLLGIVGPAVLVVQVVIVGIALAICAWVIRERREPAAPVVPVETAQASTSPDGAAPDGPDDGASGRDGRSELEPVA
jgi:uncharacterized membrane protein YfcA